jgi:hypothetical protein
MRYLFSRFIRFWWPGPGKWLLAISAFSGLTTMLNHAWTEREAHSKPKQRQRAVGRPDGPAPVNQGVPKQETLEDRPTSRVPSDPERPRQTILARKTSLFLYEVAPPAPSPSPSPSPSQRPGKARTAKRQPERWLPGGTPIRCVCWGAMESSNGLEAPLLGIVIEDVYQNCDGRNRLIIPRYTLVKCWANPGSVRNRIRISGKWLMTFLDGRSLKFDGVALACQVDASGEHVGLENATGGIIGKIVNTDPSARLEALIPLFVTYVLSASQNAAGAVLQASHTSGFYGSPDVAGVVAKYMDQLMEGRPDTTYVRVDAGTQFWVYTSDTIDPETRAIFADNRPPEEGFEPLPPAPSAVPMAAPAVVPARASYAVNPTQTPTNPNETARQHF